MRMDDGFSTLVTFELNAEVKLWEKEVTPPAVVGGAPIQTTTMHNEAVRTQNPPKLITMEQLQMTAAYDPAVLPQLQAMINKNQEITVTFPDGETWKFFGWLAEFRPGSQVEGEQPTADVVIHPSNQDADGAESQPVFSEATT